MTFDHLHAAAPTLADAAPLLSHAPAARPGTAALVLFVGAACRPGVDEAQSLARRGMRCVWLAGPDNAIEAARSARFDALVLDARALDGRDGATLARLRTALQCPLLMLADAGDEIDEIVALELGADAWLVRPLAPRRLRAHLAALMRLRQPEASPPPFCAPAVDDIAWQLDRAANRLQRGARRIDLTEVQAAFLQCLFEADGRIVARDRLLAALPLGHAVQARSVDVYIHRLRKRLVAAGVLDLAIEATRGRGYRLAVSAPALQ